MIFCVILEVVVIGDEITQLRLQQGNKNCIAMSDISKVMRPVSPSVTSAS
jgi:hypothetical protein